MYIYFLFLFFTQHLDLHVTHELPKNVEKFLASDRDVWKESRLSTTLRSSSSIGY